VATVVFTDHESVRKKLKTVYHTLGAPSNKSGIKDSSCVSGGRYDAGKMTTSHEGVSEKGEPEKKSPGAGVRDDYNNTKAEISRTMNTKVFSPTGPVLDDH
jgi:hypothetical protein